MTHIGADEIDEAGISRAQRMGIERGQTLVLPGRIENVRRRSDMGARDNEIPDAPRSPRRRCRRRRRGRDRCRSSCPWRGRPRPLRQLLIGDPPHPGEKIDPIPMLAANRATDAEPGLDIPWPVAPVRLSRFCAKMLAQRLEAAERSSASPCWRRKSSNAWRRPLSASGSENVEQRLQERQPSVRPPGSRPAAQRATGRSRWKSGASAIACTRSPEPIPERPVSR